MFQLMVESDLATDTINSDLDRNAWNVLIFQQSTFDFGYFVPLVYALLLDELNGIDYRYLVGKEKNCFDPIVHKESQRLFYGHFVS